MDPLSLTLATIGLATFCGQAVNILLQFAGQSRGVDFTIKTFADEVSNLDRVLKSITASSKDRSILSLAAGTGHEAQHWRDVVTTLGDCRSCMTRLVKILEKLEGDDGNVFKRTRKQLRLSIESGEIAVLRRQILSFTQTMQISLQMLLLSSHLSVSEANPQAILPRLDDINSNILEVLKLVRLQIQQGTPTLVSESCIVPYIKDQEKALLASSSSKGLAGLDHADLKERNLSTNMPLRLKVGRDEMDVCEEESSAACVSESSDSMSSTEPSSVEVQMQIVTTHQAVMSNMEACLRSAGSLISSVSTGLTSDTEQFLTSDFNGSVTGDRRAGIESWITSAESDHLSGDKSDGQADSSNAPAFNSIEHEILSKFYTLGKQHFEAAEYPNAEQFLCRFLAMENTNPDSDCSRRFETREMLATSYIKQRKLVDAEKILLSCIDDIPGKDPRALRATYSLAEVYLDTGQFDKAETYCQKSLKEADQVFGRAHQLVQQSGELLLEVYRNKGDFIALEAYRSAISPGRIVQGGFLWKKAVSLLSSNGFSLEGMDGERKSNALRWAAEKGLENVLLVLLETKDGIKDVVDSKDRIGKTALHYASAYGHASIASILLQNGANVEITAACTMRALHLAAIYDEVEVVRVLLDNGAEINARTADGKTVLHQAVERNSLPIMQLMLSRNADIEASDKKQRTPIFLGCKKNPVDAVRLLLLHRANVMARDSEGNTPLHWAAWYGQFSLVQLLVEHGADLSAKGVNDENPLGLAASSGHTRTVMVLLECGAPTELRNSFGRTALHFASKNGNLDIVRLLVGVGANVLACDNNGHSVIDVARDNRHDLVYKFVSARSGARR